MPLPTFVQISDEVVVSSGTSGNAVLPSVAAGNLLVALVTNIGETPITFSVADDQGDDWDSAIEESGPVTDNSVYEGHCLAANGGTTTVTVTANGSTDFRFRVFEVSRAVAGSWSVAAFSSLVETSIVTTSHNCSLDATVIDVADDDSVVFAASVADSPSGTGFGTLTPGGTYTQATSSDPRILWQYQPFASPIANERGSFTSSVGRRAAALIVAFSMTPGGDDEGTGDGNCGHKALTRVGSEIYQAGGTSGSTTVTVNAGDLLIVRVNTLDDTEVDITVEDDQAGVWRDVVTLKAAGSANKASIWACLSAIGGLTEITVSVSASCEFLATVDRGTTENGTWAVAGWSAQRETSAGGSHSCGSLDLAIPSIIIGNATVDTTSGETFGEIQNVDGEYYCDEASTQQVAHLRRVTSEGPGAQNVTFDSDNSRALVGVVAAFRTSCTSGGCWWPCCGGGGASTPEPCTVRKIDENGLEVWRYNATVDELSASVAVDRVNGKVYVAADFSGDGIGRLDAATGTLDLSFGTSGLLIILPGDNILYNFTDAYELDGTTIWLAGAGMTARPAAISGFLYSSGAAITRVDPTDGSLIWSVTGPLNGTSRQAVAASGDLWAIESDAPGFPVTLYKYLAADGTLDDSADLTALGSGASGIALDGSDNIFVTTNNVPSSSRYHLAKFDASASEQWEVSFPGLYAMNDYLPVCINQATGDIYVAGGSEVRKYNSAGVFQWAFDHTQPIYAIDCDDDGNVYLVGAEAAD